jgi:hypothetical protein
MWPFLIMFILFFVFPPWIAAAIVWAYVLVCALLAGLCYLIIGIRSLIKATRPVKSRPQPPRQSRPLRREQPGAWLDHYDEEARALIVKAAALDNARNRRVGGLPLFGLGPWGHHA